MTFHKMASLSTSDKRDSDKLLKQDPKTESVEQVESVPTPNGLNTPPAPCRNAREYGQALRPWLWQYQSCVMQAAASHLAMQMQTLSLLAAVSPSCNNNNNYFSAPWFDSGFRHRLDVNTGRRHLPFGAQPNYQHTTPATRTPTLSQTLPQAQTPDNRVVLKVPTFWKRVAAELIDFTFLFYIKMMISLVLVTEFSLDSFLLNSTSDGLLETFIELDYDRAFAITFEVILLEVINRICITIFETLCLYRVHGARGVVGATPGKRLMGLKVVSCDQVQCLGQGQVLVSPAGNISLKNAFLRSVIKNFTIAFFLPACLTLFMFKHNRTIYDVVAHTIVVEQV